MPRRNDPAPHGYDDEGVARAPYGLNTDGTPRKSNRGRRTGTSTNTPKMSSAGGAATVTGSKTDRERKGMLVQLADAFLVTPLANLSRAPGLSRKMGKHADALAGDAFIIAHFMPGLADGAILLSKSKPGFLSWMDKAEENAPYLLLAQVGMQMVKALAENHVSPRADLADAGRNLATMRMAQMAAEVNAEAERIARDAAPREDATEVLD